MNEPVSILIPAFNEQDGIGEVIDSLQRLMEAEQISGEILVIDDGSKDRTVEVVQSKGVRLIQHDSNQGYGSSLKTGIRHAQHDLMLITDADGTYPVEAIPVLLAAMDKYDMVVGARTGEHVKDSTVTSSGEVDAAEVGKLPGPGTHHRFEFRLARLSPRACRTVLFPFP